MNRVIDKITQIMQRPQRSLSEGFSLCGPCRQSKAVFDEGDVNHLRRRRSMFHYDIDLAKTKKRDITTSKYPQPKLLMATQTRSASEDDLLHH